MQLSVMSNAAFMVGFVIMEFANFAVLTMRDTHARIAPCSYLAFRCAKMCLEMIFLDSIVHPVSLAYYSSWKRLLSYPTTTDYSLVVLENYLIYLAAPTVTRLLNGLPAGYVVFSN